MDFYPHTEQRDKRTAQTLRFIAAFVISFAPPAGAQKQSKLPAQVGEIEVSNMYFA